MVSDDQLIKYCLGGNIEAFRIIVERYESRIASVIINMLGNCPEADDVGQETFIRLYKNLDRFKGNSSLVTYLTRIAINLSINELKRRRRNNQRLERINENHQNLISTNERERDSLLKVRIHKAIQELEPKFRAVVVLRLIQEYSTRETADILKIPQGTVLSRLARAQDKLRENLSDIVGA
ncbi:RNA polymerase sigma factor [candidate division KSB1 bacterium]|nr:RNA polymerase sigma factor [candidate division KSB1 bacterium]